MGRGGYGTVERGGEGLALNKIICHVTRRIHEQIEENEQKRQSIATVIVLIQFFAMNGHREKKTETHQKMYILINPSYQKGLF